MAELRRVAVTGMGIVSPVGNSTEEVVTSLREGRSGIAFCEEYAEHLPQGVKPKTAGHHRVALEVALVEP